MSKLDSQVTAMAKMFRILGDGTRLKILLKLQGPPEPLGVVVVRRTAAGLLLDEFSHPLRFGAE